MVTSSKTHTQIFNFPELLEMKFEKKIRNEQNIGEKKRLESIIRRQHEENHKKQIISKALMAEPSQFKKHVKICNVLVEGKDDDDGDRETTSRGKMTNEEEDCRFKMSDIFTDHREEDDDNGGKKVMVGKEREANGSKAMQAPPFRRYDPHNPEHVEWVHNLGRINREERAGGTVAGSGRKKMKMNEGNGPPNGEDDNDQQARVCSQSKIDPKFAEELRKKLQNRGQTEADEPFSFLAMLGHGSASTSAGPNDDIGQNGGNSAKRDKCRASDEGGSGSSKFRPRIDVNTVKEQVDGRQNGREQPSEQGMSLYRRPREGEEHVCFFFIDQHAPEIRSAVASFRRHVSEEKLRENWHKQREPMVKFYKHERKLALKNMRAKQQGQVLGKYSGGTKGGGGGGSRKQAEGEGGGGKGKHAEPPE